MMKTVTVHVYLCNEGTDSWRPTQAIDRGHGQFELLATSGYDAEDEEWQFPPGSIVRVEEVQNGTGTYLRAVSRQK